MQRKWAEMAIYERERDLRDLRLSLPRDRLRDLLRESFRSKGAIDMNGETNID